MARLRLSCLEILNGRVPAKATAPDNRDIDRWGSCHTHNQRMPSFMPRSTQGIATQLSLTKGDLLKSLCQDAIGDYALICNSHHRSLSQHPLEVRDRHPLALGGEPFD